MKNFTSEEYKKISELLSYTKEPVFFEFEDKLIKGQRVDLIKMFVSEKPSDKFLIWADKKGLIINIL